VQFAQWSALFAPATTPEPIVEKLRATVRKVISEPALQQTILNAGSPIEYLDAPQFAAYWKTDAQTMTEAVKRIGKVE
jgi:tripartite-type tricarboxylate transporter receptor subunit TctC